MMQRGVENVFDLRILMGLNDFHKDPFSLNSSCNAIACRSDLEPEPAARYPFGAIDGKVSSVTLANRRLSSDGKTALSSAAQQAMGSAAAAMLPLSPVLLARMGPTHDQSDIPPFCWADFDNARNRRDRKFYHMGHPACFDYDWITIPS
jgi:hypothetical protein